MAALCRCSLGRKRLSIVTQVSDESKQGFINIDWWIYASILDINFSTKCCSGITQATSITLLFIFDTRETVYTQSPKHFLKISQKCTEYVFRMIVLLRGPPPWRWGPWGPPSQPAPAPKM